MNRPEHPASAALTACPDPCDHGLCVRLRVARATVDRILAQARRTAHVAVHVDTPAHRRADRARV